MMYCLYVTDPGLLTNPDHLEHYARVGALISLSYQPIDPIPGTAVKQVANYGRLYSWDEAQTDMVYNRRDRILSVDDLFNRLTDDEEDQFLALAPAAIKEKIAHFRTAKRKLDLDSQRVNQLLDQMEQAGILTAARRAEVQA